MITGNYLHRKKILFHSKDVMGLLIYHLEYQTTHIPTGFVSVAISGGFCENLARLTGLYHVPRLGISRQIPVQLRRFRLLTPSSALSLPVDLRAPKLPVPVRTLPLVRACRPWITVKRAGCGCDACSQRFAATCAAVHRRTSLTEVRVSARQQAVLRHCCRSPVHRYCPSDPPIY